MRIHRKDGLPQPAKVHSVLDQRRGVPISLEDNCLRLIVVQVDLVLQGPVSLVRAISIA